MKSWQEKYALWMLRPKWPMHLNEKLSHWWIFALLGLFLGTMIIYVFTVLIPGIFDDPLNSRIVSSLAENHEVDPQKRIDILLDQQAFMRDSFVRILKLFGFLLAGLVSLSYLLVGLIWEERKGYRRVIEKLQSKSNTTAPNQSGEGTA